jgi:hypothetical protein
VIHFEGFDAKSWHRIVTLFAPGLASRPPNEHALRARTPGGLLVIVHKDNQVRAAMHSHRGRCDIAEFHGVASIPKLAEQWEARFAVVIEEGAVELMLDRWGARVDPEEPALEAWLLLIDAVRELVDENKLYVWPDLVPGGVPRPTRAVIDAACDLVLPAGKAAFALLFRDDATLDAAAVIARPVGAPVTVFGTEKVVSSVGALSGDPRRDLSLMRAWLERELGPVHFGVHTQSSTLEALLRSDQPGAWSRAFNEGQVRIEPTPPWVVAALGVDIARTAIAIARGALGSLVDRVTPALESATRMVSARATLSGILGLDLGSLLGSVLRRSGASTSSNTDDVD